MPTYKGHPRGWWDYTGSKPDIYQQWVNGLWDTKTFQTITPPGEGTAALEAPDGDSTDSGGGSDTTGDADSSSDDRQSGLTDTSGDADSSSDDRQSGLTDTSGDGTPSVDSAAEARERYGPGADQASTGGLVDTSGGSSGDPTETTSPSGSGSMAGLSDTAMLAGLAALGIAAIAYRRGS